jgi:ABC-2 type transport system ATP-binding protein
MAAIEINGISKRFGTVQAVSDLSFQVDGGRITGFLPQGLAVLAMLAWIGGLFAAGAALLQTRDVD